MPDSLSGNPWSIVTTGVKSTAGVHIKNLLWTNGAAGNVLVVVDSAGRDIIRDLWENNVDHNYGEFKWVQGFNVTTLGGGELIVVIHK